MKKWKLLFKPPYMQGHKVYLDEKGAYCIADWSGVTPDDTDDGVLIVRPGTKATVQLRSNTLVVDLPVVMADGTNAHTSTALGTALALHSYVGLRLQAGVELCTLMSVLDDLKGKLT